MTHYPLSHNANFLQTIVQCYNQHTDIAIVKIQHLSIITSVPNVVWVFFIATYTPLLPPHPMCQTRFI